MLAAKKIVPENLTQIFPTSSTEIPCSTYNCYTMSAYHMGRPDGPPNMRVNLCQKCAEDLVLNLPSELVKLLLAEQEVEQKTPLQLVKETGGEVNAETVEPEKETCDCDEDTVCGLCAYDKNYLVCDECLKICSTENGLRQHKKYVHKGL